jgi:hypothetical protein
MKAINFEVIGRNEAGVFDSVEEVHVLQGTKVRDAVSVLKRQFDLEQSFFGLFVILRNPRFRVLDEDEDLYALASDGVRLLAVLLPFLGREEAAREVKTQNSNGPSMSRKGPRRVYRPKRRWRGNTEEAPGRNISPSVSKSRGLGG